MGKKKAVSRKRELEVKQATAHDAKAAEQPVETQTAAGQEEQEPVRCIHEYTDREFRLGFPKVYKGLMEKATSGGTAQVRLLLEIGKFGDWKGAKERGEKTLSEMLLDELKRRQDEREAAAATTEPETAAKTDDGEDATSGGNVETE